MIGGGITGCAAAALLAEAGASVTLYEREEIAAGASGATRACSSTRWTVDRAAVRGVAGPVRGARARLRVPGRGERAARGRHDGPTAAADCDAIAAEFPELAPEWLEGAALQAAEPALAGDLCAYRLARGRPVPPAAATRAWAERARGRRRAES